MFRIGTADWVRELKQATGSLGSDFWSDFRPASEQQMRAVEQQLGRKLDSEFLEFYRTIGYGEFPTFGEFYNPEEII